MITNSLIFAFIGFTISIYAADTPRTPDSGSAERLAICDAARAYTIKEYVSPTKLPQPLVFKVSTMKVLGNYCCFEATPYFKDGTPMDTKYIMDIVFLFFLERNHGKWRVMNDVSSTDVPTDSQLRQMWRNFPKDFPIVLIPKFWRDHFNRVNKGADNSEQRGSLNRTVNLKYAYSLI